jgi:peptidoglycan lytic transglycosylase
MRYGRVLTFAAVILCGCAHKKHARIPVPPPAVQVGQTETGLASWYGHPYHGRQAANGEIYDMEKLTAAHRTLPFNTWVRVENLSNDKFVEVRITDRGPFIDGRIIDLSHAAARAIDMIGPGVTRVKVKVIEAPRVLVTTVTSASAPVAPPVEDTANARFAVQVGVFRDRQNAERVRRDMEARYGAARLVLREGNPVMWRVLVGSEGSEDAASALSDRIQRESGEKSAFVVRLDS